MRGGVAAAVVRRGYYAALQRLIGISWRGKEGEGGSGWEKGAYKKNFGSPPHTAFSNALRSAGVFGMGLQIARGLVVSWAVR